MPNNSNVNVNSDPVEVFFVVRRRRQGGFIEYSVGSNLMPLPKGWRQEWGTSSLVREAAAFRVRACQEGTWWGDKKSRGIAMSRANQAQRKAVHEAYKRSKRKESFDWHKLQRLTLDF